ncbi:MAG: hypothetical protein HQK76_05120 [Desulfobacterales bacterium]|nr:hypothetical protein [Desulfobacterales bacterium]
MILPSNSVNFKQDFLCVNKKRQYFDTNKIFSHILKGTMKNNGINQDEKKIEAISLQNSSRIDFIENLKKYLISKGYNLDQLVLNDKSLKEFEKLLGLAGFKPDETSKIMNEVKSDSDKGIKASELFSKLSQQYQSLSGKEDKFIDMSFLPHLESTLSLLGLNAEHIQDALSNSKIDGKGINVSTLSANLKKIRNEMGKTFPTEMSQSQALNLMEEMGLSEDTLQTTQSINLDKFIYNLEKKYNSNLSYNKGSMFNNILNSFMNNFEFQPNSNGIKFPIKNINSAIAV